jgi:hypothetical protein
MLMLRRRNSDVITRKSYPRAWTTLFYFEDRRGVTSIRKVRFFVRLSSERPCGILVERPCVTMAGVFIMWYGPPPSTPSSHPLPPSSCALDRKLVHNVMKGMHFSPPAYLRLLLSLLIKIGWGRSLYKCTIIGVVKALTEMNSQW